MDEHLNLSLRILPVHFCAFQVAIIVWHTPHADISARTVEKLCEHSSIDRPRVHDFVNPPTIGLALKQKKIRRAHENRSTHSGMLGLLGLLGGFTGF